MTYSVAMCTYNGSKYVTEQLNSILNQTVLPDEIIISDDGSTDSTVEIIKSVLSSSNVPYHIYTDNPKHGVVGNFWYAFSKCNSDVIFSCDQDDVWLPQKAEKLLQIFDKHKEALLVFSNGKIVDADLTPLDTIWNSLDFSMKVLDHTDWATLLLSRRIVSGTAMAFKKCLFNYNDTVPRVLLHDGFLAIKAAINNGVYCCEEPLILYRQHANNVVGMKRESIWNKMKRYFSNFKGMRAVRIDLYKGWQSLDTYFSVDSNPTARSFLDNCVAFWADMVTAQESHIFKRLSICHKHWKSGNYKKYYCGFRGYVRDVILSFVDWTEKKGDSNK